jgi:hypothetical protein
LHDEQAIRRHISQNLDSKSGNDVGTTDQPDLNPIWFSRNKITRREAIGVLAGSAVTAGIAFFFVGSSPSQVLTTTTTTRVEATTTTAGLQATTTTAALQATTTAAGSVTNYPPSYVAHSVLATGTLDTDLIR